MDKKTKKIIDEAISCLNWDVILETYRDYERSDRKKTVTIHTIKLDLRNLCRFIIENNINYFDQEQFIVIWRHSEIDNKLGSKLEILYVPTRSCSYTEEFSDLDADTDAIQVELDALGRLIDSAVAEENYELAAVLRDRKLVVQQELSR